MTEQKNEEGEFKRRIDDLFVPLIKFTEGKTPLFVNLPEALKGMIEDAKKDMLEHADVSEITEPDNSETPVIIIELTTWKKWLGVVDNKKEEQK